MSIVYIAGRGRSGSTLLGVILGQLPGWLSIGELRNIFEPGADCGCGQPALSCPFWSSVIETAERRVGELDPATVLKRQNEVLGPRRTLSILRDPEQPGVKYLSDVYCAIYDAISERSGASVLVDESKSPSFAAAILRKRPFVVHLVRDPRASAYSWAHRRRERQNTLDPRRAAMRWLQWNYLNDLVIRHLEPGRSVLLRYEDFVARPAKTVQSIAQLAGSTFPAGMLSDRTTELLPNHMLCGNPLKYRTGTVAIKGDEAWREGSSIFEKLLVTAITWPLMIRYGYLASRRISLDETVGRRRESEADAA